MLPDADAEDWMLALATRPADGADASERARILSALNDCAGNQTRAARMLGISRRTMISRLDKLGIARPQRKALRALPAERIHAH